MNTSWRKWVYYGAVAILFFMFLPVLSFASSNVGNAVNDSVITGKIKAALSVNEVTHALNISVETNDGIVTLTGTVNSNTEASKAIEIAESTVGVKDVNVDHFYVHDSSQPFTDSYLTAKVKGTFLRNNLTPGKINVPLVDVKVETQNGVVYLSGTVKNDRERQRLISLAKSVNGVTDVKSTVHLQ